MNLPAESMTPSDQQQASSVTRVTFDPVEAQEALDRSFQPFSDQMYDRESRPGKRRAADNRQLHADKRYRQQQQQTLAHFEPNTSYAMS